MQLSDLIGNSASVLIQYIDVDKLTLLHEKKAEGIVHQVDDQIGIVVAVNGDQQDLFKVPPLLEAWQQQVDGSYKVHWKVFRTQQERKDGVHEWWDWQPSFQQ